MQVTDTQQVALAVSWLDRLGNPIPNPDGDILTWATSDATIVQVTDNGDGTAMAVTTGTVGSVVVTASDDLDADGNPDFLGSLAIDVVSGPVAEVQVVAGAVTERP